MSPVLATRLGTASSRKQKVKSPRGSVAGRVAVKPLHSAFPLHAAAAASREVSRSEVQLVTLLMSTKALGVTVKLATGVHWPAAGGGAVQLDRGKGEWGTVSHSHQGRPRRGARAADRYAFKAPVDAYAWTELAMGLTTASRRL